MTKTKTPAKKQEKPVRLDKNIAPDKYTLKIKPDLEAFTFDGYEVIDIIIKKPVTSITLHSKDIKIESAQLTNGARFEFATEIKYDKSEETATFVFPRPMKGKVKLSLTFSGIINEHLRGFYRSRYNINGETKYLATTQFEATDARRAFPCFDEPAYKAVFDVSLIIPGSHTAISNTLPSQILEHEGGYKVIEFASTPRMSTYLLAFVIGEFEYVEKFTKDNVQVRVFTTNGKRHQAQFALDVASRSLEFYNKYFDIPYPLPTLDLIAIPDFESAAMENWGAVTFRETAILIDDEHSSLSNKQWVAIVIAHEIAHQWFGNLVTMEWWTDLWLNEGYASYMENVCVDNLFPDWKIWELYTSDRYSAALYLDSLANSHPIEIPVHHPDEINEIFDAVSYAKGSAIIRQLAEYLGYEKFRDGLRHYLKKHSYKNTSTIDLWASFEKISKKPVKKIMSNWTKKTGYPLITLKKSKHIYKLSQERFFSSRLSARKNKEKTLWQIPLKYESMPMSKNDTSTMHTLMTKKSSPLMGKSIGKVNIGESSFVRVAYDKETLKVLKEEIVSGKLQTADRLGIIRDLFALAEGGYIKTDEVLEFTLAFKNESEYIVWSEIAIGIKRIYNIIKDEPFENKYKKYALDLFNPVVLKMGWEHIKGEDGSQVFLRSLILSQAGFYGNKEVITEAKNLFKNSKNNPLSSDIRGVVYGIVARNGGEKEWKNFVSLYKTEQMHEEKERYGRALTAFKTKVLLGKTLKFAMSDNVRAQDAPHMITGVWQNISGRDLTWKFIKSNWKTILKKYGEGGHFLARLLSPLGSHIRRGDLADAKKFFKTNVAPGAERTLEQVYERIESNNAWHKADKVCIRKWLDKNF